MQRIVIITGFESFNSNLYREAAQLARSRCPDLEILAFSDRSLTTEDFLPMRLSLTDAIG
jgi:magnesium chelatase subunit H